MGTEHDAVAAVPERVQEPEGKFPIFTLTWPVGVVAPVVEVSVTVAVQVLVTPASIGFGLHDTVVVVA